MRRLVVLTALAALLAGCGGSATPPEVTFTAGPASAVAKPTQFCTCICKIVRVTRMRGAARRPRGTALKVTVPSESSSAPWQVVFTYRSATAADPTASPVLAPDQHPDYTLQLPAATDALITRPSRCRMAP